MLGATIRTVEGVLEVVMADNDSNSFLWFLAGLGFGAIAGMAAGLGAMLYITFETKLVWTWYVLVGTLVTLAAGSLMSLFGKAAPENS